MFDLQIKRNKLYYYMGHISLDAAKCMVKDGLVSGIELDETPHLPLIIHVNMRR